MLCKQAVLQAIPRSSAAAMLLGYIVLVVAAAVALAVAVCVVRYYQCPDSAQPFTTAIAAACIAFLLMSVLVIPVDVYNSSAGVAAAAAHQPLLRSLDFGIYTAIIAMLFLVLPFAYFFHDEEGEHATAAVKPATRATSSMG